MTTKIDYQGVHLEGQLITPDTLEWHEWLATAKSFRFELNHETWIDGRVPKVDTLSFSGIKAGNYWQAHKKVGGILRREHLGKSPSYAKLKEAAILINSGSYGSHRQLKPKSVSQESHKDSETVSEHSSQNANEIAQLKAELERVKAQLSKEAADAARYYREMCVERDEKGNWQGRAYKAEQRAKELEAQLTELKVEREELHTRLGNSGRSTPGIDLTEFYDAVMLKHPPRERKVISRPLTRFKTLVAEALIRRGVPVRQD